MIQDIKKEKLSNAFYRLLLKKIALLKDPLWKIVNISQVKTDKGGQTYYIFYTLWQPRALKKVELFLEKNKGKIKKLISKNWKLSRLPKMIFLHDKNLINAEKVETILQKLKNNE